jgi:anti-anti-sigma factor
LEIDLEHRFDARVCVVHISGELDLGTVPRVRQRISDALTGGCVNVVLDMADVAYADSSTFSLLVWLDRELEPRDGKLILAGANANVGRVLELSGLVGAAPTIGAADDVTSALSGLESIDDNTPPLWIERMVLPATADTLASARGMVCDVLEPLDIADAGLFDIRVAVGEALANAIRHGSPGGDADQVSIEVSAYADRVMIRVSDSGNGFDGCSVPNEDLYASSGRGVMFMRALMDHVEFESCTDGGTVVTLVKHVSPNPR